MKVMKSENVVFRELESEGGGVLLRVDDGAYHGLNQVGCVIWEMIGDGITLEDLVADMASRFEDPPDRMHAEVESFVSALLDRGLLVVGD
ncbi:MAG TPA: PqqD family protein [Acidimicrobiia bacterium]|nr:PqqD family protein [Acidimicrobiia bacterium]